MNITPSTFSNAPDSWLISPECPPSCTWRSKVVIVVRLMDIYLHTCWFLHTQANRRSHWTVLMNERRGGMTMWSGYTGLAGTPEPWTHVECDNMLLLFLLQRRYGLNTNYCADTRRHRPMSGGTERRLAEFQGLVAMQALLEWLLLEMITTVGLS